jgi:hypothetical protein
MIAAIAGLLPRLALRLGDAKSLRALDFARSGDRSLSLSIGVKASPQIDPGIRRGDGRHRAPAGKPRQILLELIEVQTASYLGKDDIIRPGNRHPQGQEPPVNR